MGKRILIFGSFVTDLCCRTNRLPEAGETVKGHYFKHGPGGKGSNQAIAAHRAGADVTFVTKLGDDTFGREALAFYEAENMCTDMVFVSEEHPSGTALIIVDELTAQNQIAVFGGACECFTDDDVAKVVGELENSDILLVQLETNLEPVKVLLKHAKRGGLLTVLNPAPAQHLDTEHLQNVDIITPNETEAQILTGVTVTDIDSARAAADKLISMGVGKAVITLGENGAYANDGANERIYDIVKCAAPVDSTGAGDAFSGGLVAALAKGYCFFDAIAYASTVAGLSVTRHGTAPAMPFQDEIDRIYESIRK